MSHLVGSEVLVVTTLPPIQGVVVESRTNGWLTVEHADTGERIKYRLGDVITL